MFASAVQYYHNHSRSQHMDRPCSPVAASPIILDTLLFRHVLEGQTYVNIRIMWLGVIRQCQSVL